MVCVLAKLGHVFAVGSLSCAQKSFGKVAKFLFWAKTKLHKQVLQKMATPVYYATHCIMQNPVDCVGTCLAQNIAKPEGLTPKAVQIQKSD